VHGELLGQRAEVIEASGRWQVERTHAWQNSALVEQDAGVAES
jgi:hypothetical protein